VKEKKEWRMDRVRAAMLSTLLRADKKPERKGKKKKGKKEGERS